MHYKDGTEAKVFDRVKGKMYGPDGYAEREGVLVSITPGCTSCNGQVVTGDLEHLGGASIKTMKDDGMIVWKQAILVGHGNLNTMTIGELELVERVTDAHAAEKAATTGRTVDLDAPPVTPAKLA